MKTNKWKSILDSLKVTDEQRNWMEEYTKLHESQKDELSNISGIPSSMSGSPSGISSFDSMNLLPIATRVAATTIGMGGWQKSKKQQLKEDRINKLRKLDGKEPNVVLPDDEEVPGLVSVQPLSAPTGLLTYLDFKYTNIKEERRKKLEEIEKRQKIFEILEALKNNGKPQK